MRIANLFTDIAGRLALGDRREAPPVTLGGAASPSNVEGAAENGSPPAEGLDRFDVADITPRRLAEILEQLRQLGVLAAGDYAELAMIRVDLDLSGIDPDEAVNLIDFYGERIARLRGEIETSRSDADRAAAEQRLATAHERLHWVSKLAVVQSSPDAVGLSALA